MKKQISERNKTEHNCLFIYLIGKYYKYNRQYAGFINTSGEKIIYIVMFNFANSKKGQKDRLVRKTPE